MLLIIGSKRGTDRWEVDLNPSETINVMYFSIHIYIDVV
jgi:hypothetical protein